MGKTIRESLIKFDKDLNEKWGGVPDTTISVQSATGLNARRDFKFTDKQALDLAHLNMAASGLCFIGAGIAVKQKNPWLALGLALGGALIANQVRNDWKRGGEVLRLRTNNI